MKYEWKDLPKPMNCFTVRSATMKDLSTGKIIQHYSANTKIVVTQKCVASTATYYRTREAARHCLDYAFEASAFGLPNEIAPSVPSTPFTNRCGKPVNRTLNPARKQKNISKAVSAKDGGTRLGEGWLSRLFRRKNG